MNPNNLLREIKESGKTVLVIGLGISGLESLKFLVRSGIKAIGVDRASSEQFERSNKFPRELEEVKERDTLLIFGVNSLSDLPNREEIALTILSPGIPLSSPLVVELQSQRTPLISEFELGLELLQRPTIVVTGSNGKSTTVSLIHHILVNSGIEAFLCGNVGTPVIAGVPNLEISSDTTKAQGWVVAEASSYQLESCQVLKPQIGVFLNLTENHLERHGNLESYLAAKLNLFSRMDHGGIAIYPQCDPMIGAPLSHLPMKKMPIIIEAQDQQKGHAGDSPTRTGSGSAVIKSEAVQYERVTVSTSEWEVNVALTDLNLIGSHNRLNGAFAVTAALLAGVDPNKIAPALGSFSALEHRLRRVPGVKELWINDSKSTTVAATVAALNSILVDFPERKVTLLVGGQLKIGSWASLADLINSNSSKIAQLIVFGGDRDKIRASLGEMRCEVVIAEWVRDAIRLAETSAQAGDVVLFSPAALSFDEFRSFGERGEAFERWVQEISL